MVRKAADPGPTGIQRELQQCSWHVAGLDARAAAIVMRVVRNIVATGRTITVTIHQPAIDIFEVSSTDGSQLTSVPAAVSERGLHSMHVHAVCRPVAAVSTHAAKKLQWHQLLSSWHSGLTLEHGGSLAHSSPVCVQALQACHELLGRCLQIVACSPLTTCF